MAVTLNFTLTQVVKNTSIQTNSSGRISANEPIPVRVLGVILDENDKFFENSDIDIDSRRNYFGTIKFQDYNNPIYNQETEANLTLLARPINPNVKHYPLKNEIVYVLALPNQDSKNNLNTYSFYYYPPINMENNISSNPVVPTYQNQQSNPTPSNEEAINGVLTNVGGEKKEISNLLGSFFPQNLSKTLSKTFEGDIMYEGRFGNSLRFSSDIYKREKGKGIGEPLTILANQAGDSLIEDINRDKASVYLTTNQQITINAANNADLTSFNVVPPPVAPGEDIDRENEQAFQSPDPVPTVRQKENEEKLKNKKFNDFEEIGIYKGNDNKDTLIYLITNPNGTTAAMGEGLIEPFIKMRDAAAQDNVILNVTSGFRPPFGNGLFFKGKKIASSQEQLRKRNLLPKWKGKVDPNNPNLRKLEVYFNPETAPPGKSDHGDSLAADIQVAGGTNKSYRWLFNNAEKFGFVRTVPKEAWHWGYRPGAGKYDYVPQNDPSWNKLI